MRSTDEVMGWRSRKALDRDGDKLGTIEEIYLDAESGHPQWAAVKTGLLGSKLTFVPLEGARPQDDDVVLDWPKHVVKEAPSIDADGELSPEGEDRLYDHYERYDTPEHHGGSAAEGGSSRDDDDVAPAAATGAAVSRGVGRGDDDAGPRGQGGRDAGPGQAVSGDPGSSSGGTVSPGQSASSGGDTSSSTDASAGGTRRPRIKRFIEEELGPDGNPVRRSTRTEETFD